jgi:hypothetical protein
MTSYYLAHPILSREDIRNKELAFEKRTGIELVNPFYDGEEADVIRDLDAGKFTLQEYAAKLNEKGLGRDFVKDDLRAIDKYDGVVAVIYRGTPTVGTSMEIMYDVVRYAMFPRFLKDWLRKHDIKFDEAEIDGMAKKPVYIVTNFPSHIWIVFAAKESGGFVVETWSELEERLTAVKAKEERKHGS